jgi:hypothetical protein
VKSGTGNPDKNLNIQSTSFDLKTLLFPLLHIIVEVLRALGAENPKSGNTAELKRNKEKERTKLDCCITPKVS